jgi:type IV secretion system protein VirB1
MHTFDFIALAGACAPAIHAQTAAALVQVESAYNPWAIGVVGGVLRRQPRSRGEALATARALQATGWDFSVGLGQINARNFARLGLTLETAFDPCTNLRAMQVILSECFDRAQASVAGTGTGSRQQALRHALSCYYSGNFATGIRHGYVHRVVAASTAAMRPVTSLPSRPPTASKENA